MPFIIPFFISHQGCPHQCLFCNQHSITGAVFDPEEAARSIETTICEWLGYRRRQRSAQFAFYGGSFTCLPEERQKTLLAAVRPWLDRGVIDSIRLSTRPDCLDGASCERLKEAGVALVELGVQSFDDRVLAASRRGHTGADAAAACRLLGESGLAFGIQLMPGLPGETRRSFLAGVRRAIALRPALVRLYPTLVIAGTPLARSYEKGHYRPLSLALATVLLARAHALLSEAGIAVARMGLQSSPALERDLLAGPYHPALGELVLARRWLARVRRLLAAYPGERLRLSISPRDLSAFNGVGGANRKRLRQLGLEGRLELVLDTNLQRNTLHYAVCQ